VPRGAFRTMSARFSANEPSLFAEPAISPTGVASSSRIADDERMSDVPKLTADERAAITRVLQRTLETARFPLSPRLAPLRSALVKLDKPPPPAPERVTTISEQLPTEPRAALYRTQTRKAHWLPIIIGVPVVVGLIAAAMYWIDRSERTARAVLTPVPIVAPPSTPAATALPTPPAPAPAAADAPAPASRFIIGIPTAQPPTPPTAPPPAPPAGPAPNLVSGLPPLGAAPQAEAPAAAPPPPEAEAPAAPKQKHPRTAAPPPSGQVRF
jgi:hypothetical protein